MVSEKLEYLFEQITDDCKEKFKELKINEEYFLHGLKFVIQHSAHLFDTEGEQKNSQHSVRSRENGNISFKNGKYYNAVQEYTESIIYAIDSSEELAMAYANRSAALFKLEKYADCVEDIDKALNLNYPDKLKSKLYKRKGLCLRTLANPGADSCFNEALVWLDKMNLSSTEMNKRKTELSKLIQTRNVDSKAPIKMKEYLLPVILTPNSEAPAASDAVAINYSQRFGRHLVATRKIKPGEILVVEKPYCLRIKPTNIYTHCSHCLQVSWNMIPCKCCVNAAYCSETCRQTAWDKYHEVECPIAGPLLDFEFNNVIWISTRIAIMATQKGVNLNALKRELLNVDRNEDPRTKGYSDDNKFQSDQYRSIYSLSNNVEKCSIDHLLWSAISVAVIVCIMARESKMFGNKLTLDTLAQNTDVVFVGALMLKHVYTVSINVNSFGSSRCATTNEHGHALMAVCSLLNHSCDPNTIRQWYADCMVLYACQPIDEGEQIFDNYGPRYSSMPKSERQKHFINRWHFKCGCVPCTDNWPQMEQLPSYRNRPTIQRNKRILDKIMQKFAQHSFSIATGNFAASPNMLNDVLESIEVLFKFTRRPNLELSMAISTLKEYYSTADEIFMYEPADLNKIKMP